MSAALVVMLMLGADPAPSKHVKTYLDARDDYRAAQIVRLKEKIVWCENKLAEWEKKPPKTPSGFGMPKGVPDKQKMKKAQQQLAELRKALSKLESTTDIAPELRSPKVGMIGALPTRFPDFDAEEGFILCQCSYQIYESTPAGTPAKVWMKIKPHADGDLFEFMLNVDLHAEMIKGQRVDKLLAGKVWQVTESEKRNTFTLEPFDMAEVEAFLKAKQ